MCYRIKLGDFGVSRNLDKTTDLGECLRCDVSSMFT